MTRRGQAVPRAADGRKGRGKGLVERLAEAPVICAEGYLFELERRGYVQAGAFVPEAVLDHPDVVAQVHRDFVHAGSDIRFGLLGGRFVGEGALLRFYVLHCLGFPLVAATLMAVHFWRVRKDGGISGPL